MVVVILLFVLYMHLPIGIDASSPSSLQTLHKAAEMERIIDKYFLYDADKEQLADYMMLGLASGLEDQYASYYTEDEYESIRKKHKGMMVGIGVTMAQEAETERLRVTLVLAGSPAEEAGVRKGDYILEINGTDASKMSSSEAAQLIASLGDEVVVLKLERTGVTDPVTVEMRRGEIEITSVSSEMLEGKTGYIRIGAFNEKTSGQFEDAYKELQKQGMDSLVIDLRDNLGGLVSSCCDTVSQILPKGVIVYEEDRKGTRSQRSSDTDTPIEVPLVILVNKNTASASEIFTAAVQDYGLCTVVGTVTYGKGIEQNSYTLADGSVFKLTTIHYYTPENRDINGCGITPDTEVVPDEFAESDVQLEKALEILREETAG